MFLKIHSCSQRQVRKHLRRCIAVVTHENQQQMLRLAESRAKPQCLVPSGVERAAAPDNPSRPERRAGRGCVSSMQRRSLPPPPPGTEDASGVRRSFLRQGEQQMLRAGHAAAKLPRPADSARKSTRFRGRRVCRFFQFNRLLCLKSLDAAGGGL